LHLVLFVSCVVQEVCVLVLHLSCKLENEKVGFITCLDAIYKMQRKSISFLFKATRWVPSYTFTRACFADNIF